MAERIFRKKQMTAVTGLSETEIWERVQSGELDRPIPLGKRAVGWLESSVDKWQRARIAERDAEEAAWAAPDPSGKPLTPTAMRRAATKTMREARLKALTEKVGA